MSIPEDRARADLQRELGHEFRDPGLLALALTHGSAQDPTLGTNERLEFLGDAVIAAATSFLLYAHERKLSEGEMTKARARLVSRKHLAVVGERLGLRRHLRVGPMFPDASAIPTAVVSNAVEALVGAAALDAGIDVAIRMAQALLAADVAPAIDALADHDWKGLLGHVARTEHQGDATFVLVSALGPDHARTFECAVDLAGRRFPSGYGRSKREAEQRAAWAALRTLGRAEASP